MVYRTMMHLTYRLLWQLCFYLCGLCSVLGICESLSAEEQASSRDTKSVPKSVMVSGDLIPSNLLCEHMCNPLGIDVSRPRFSWSFQEAQRRGLHQRAYQILVASDEDLLKDDRADLWNSGKVSSDNNIEVYYSGKPLPSGTRCYWKVRVWDHDDNVQTSGTAYFEMGLLRESDWKGAAWIAWRDQEQWQSEYDARKKIENKHFLSYKERKKKRVKSSLDPNDGWIFPTKYQKQPTDNWRETAFDIFSMYRFHTNPYDPAPLFRKEFTVNKPVRRASLYICGLGYYELYLNEKRVGDHVLDPGWTDNNSRVLYVTYDVTEQLSKGGNAIGIMLGRGFPGSLVNDTWEFYKHSHQPRMRMLLNIEYTDGTRTDIISEPGWKVTGGPVVFDCPYRGEVIDARRERFGWNKAGFNASSWDSAVSSPAPAGEMTAQAIDPIRTKEEIRPQSVTNPKPGVYVFDFGKNISGWVRLKTSGPSGTEILVRYSEKNDPDVPLPTPGSFHFSYQQHGFILKGKGVETLEPKFSYTGFRYAIVSGAVESLDADSLTAVHVHTDVDTEGNFQCSNPLLNKIHRATRLTLLNNMQSIPHDCPTREKHGWGDIWTSEAAIYNFETAAFYEKWLDDWYDIESHNGKGGWLYYYAPHPKGRTGSVAPCWWATSINIPWTLYVYYGDRQILANHYVAMKRVINAMASARVAKDDAYIIKGKFGDWASPGGSKPKEGVNIYGNACYFHCVDTLSKIADVLEKKEDAIRYRKLAADIKRAFNRKFYDSEMNCYRGENRQIKEYRQSADAVPLYMGLVPVEKHQSIIGNLLENLSQRKERLNTGYLGTKALMEVLPAYGQGETTYRVASQTAFPGWGYFINNLNTTTIPEKWTAGNSQNHLSYVSVGAYYYRWLGGLQPYPEKPGFRHFFLRPTFVKDLDFVRVKYQSPSGLIRSSWTRGDGTLKWEIVIPPNTTASVIIPASVEKITESNSPAEQAKGVKLIKDEKENEKTSEFLVGSGFYNFEFVDNR